MITVGAGISDVELGVDAHGVVRGPVEQLRDVDRDVIGVGGQFALRKAFQRPERCLDSRLRPDNVVQHFLALLIGKVEGGQHLQVGPHCCERGA
jgi:hypothetical protein